MTSAWWEMLDRVGFETMGLLLTVLWQSTLLLACTALLTRLLRNRPAVARRKLWAFAFLTIALLPLLNRFCADMGAPRADLAVIPRLESLWAPAVAVYCAVTTAFLGLIALGRLRIHRWLRRGRVLGGRPLMRKFLDTQWWARVPGGLVIVESDHVHAPLTVRIFRPAILLPAGLPDRLSESDLQAVLLHEMAHIDRRDPLALTLASFVRALLWFNPFVWLAARRLATAAELAADDAVLDVTDGPVPYAKMLTQMAEGLPSHALVTEFAAGFVLAKSSFLQRVEAILSERRESIRRLTRWALAGTLGTVALALAVTLGVPLRPQPGLAGRTDPGDGPLDIRFVGVCPDWGDAILDANGKRIGTWFGLAREGWGYYVSRHALIFELPKGAEPLFLPEPDAFVSGKDYRIRSVMIGCGKGLADPRRCIVGMDPAETYRGWVLGMLPRQMPVERVDVTLQYYYGSRRESVVSFTGPFTVGAAVEADGGAKARLVPRKNFGSGRDATARFRLKSHRDIVQGRHLVLAYDTEGRRHLPRTPSGFPGPDGACLLLEFGDCPLSRIASITVGEPVYEQTFRDIRVAYDDRPRRTHPEYLDRMTAALGMEAETAIPTLTLEQTLAVMPMVRGWRVHSVLHSFYKENVDIAELGPEDARRVREAAAAWLTAFSTKIQGIGVSVGLMGRWPEFVEPAMMLLAQEGIDGRGSVAHSLHCHADMLSDEQRRRICDLLLATDDRLIVESLRRMLLRSPAIDTDFAWTLARADKDRPWLWWPALDRLVDHHKLIGPDTALSRELQIRLAMMGRPIQCDEAARQEARRRLFFLLTPKFREMDEILFRDVIRKLSAVAGVKTATGAFVQYFRDAEYIHNMDSVVSRMVRQINAWHGIDIGGLGADVKRTPSDIHTFDMAKLAAKAVRWHAARRE
ncbi:M56 family metallopeptidase [bacterium]|nr:M56 family metallopeptidase [bacterium]